MLTSEEAELVEQLRERVADYEDTQALIAVIDRLVGLSALLSASLADAERKVNDIEERFGLDSTIYDACADMAQNADEIKQSILDDEGWFSP